ncbi:SDR family oxidoreductase [Bauldia sp.]|uniref:SDR family oxidoreductase n=1 Tax=Bauldia sp. TaxID=2575872 RepID=UPI003BAA2123
MTDRPTVAVLGASGLIGAAIVAGLQDRGIPVVALARRFTDAQRATFGEAAAETAFAALEAADLARLFRDRDIDIVVNCVGVLQGGGAEGTDAVHRDFVGRLLSALADQPEPALLVHASIPGEAANDSTDFARSKRDGERLVAGSTIPHVVLRPGFVIAPAAYGGSALMRALATLPVALPADLAARPFAIVDSDDIVATVEAIARRWAAGERDWANTWDLMAPEVPTVGAVVDGFRRRYGGPTPRVTTPGWALDLGAKAGDLVARLGWRPPIRSTALAEMRRGVTGDPGPWIAATGIPPRTLAESLRRLPVSVQEGWFARLYLAKPVIIAVLVVFWAVSGIIALSSFGLATGLLTARGFPAGFAVATTIVSSVMDIAVGIAIAFRRTCRFGLYAGILVSIFYMAGAAVLTPDLWFEPLGALVKTGPAIVLMMVGLATLEDRG